MLLSLGAPRACGVRNSDAIPFAFASSFATPPDPESSSRLEAVHVPISVPLPLAAPCHSRGLRSRGGSSSDAVVGDGTPASCTELALDAAVASANSGGGTITFACGAEPVTIALTGAKTITAFVTVDSDLLVTLSGGNATRHFVVAAGGYLTLRDIALVQGQAAGGGAILAEATSEVHFFFTTITDNVSTTVGGAIAATGAVVHGNNSRIADNQAAGAGGAIHLTGGRLDLALVLVHGNSAGGAGGAVSISNCNQLAVLLASFDKNVAGGDGGGLDVSNCSGFLEQTQIVMNTAGGKGGGMHLVERLVGVARRTTRSAATVPRKGAGCSSSAGTSSIHRQVTLSGNQAVAARRARRCDCEPRDAATREQRRSPATAPPARAAACIRRARRRCAS